MTTASLEKVASLTVERKKLAEINKPHPKNPRRHPAKGSPEWVQMVKSLANDYFDPIVWNKRNGMLVSGHFRVKVMLAEGYTHADVVVVDYDEATHLARMVAANNHSGEPDKSLLQEIVGQLAGIDSMVDLTGFTAESVMSMMRPADEPPPVSSEQKETLAQKFGLTPLSVLDARQHYWKKRGEAWSSILGIESEVDPVLVEAVLRWYSTAVPGVVDLNGKEPMRGLVAGHLGIPYVGIADEGNAAANNALASTKTLEKAPRYVTVDENVGMYDLAIYETPAFASLKEMNAEIDQQFRRAEALLQPNRFFIVFVGAQKKLRSKALYDSDAECVEVCYDNAKNFNLISEAILLRPLGGTPMACRSFPATRRLARCHATMLVFFRGKVEEIEKTFPFPAMGDLSE